MAAAILSICLITGCGKVEQKEIVDTPEPAPQVLAEINGKPITEETFRYWWEKKLPAENDEAARNAVLKQLIERSVIAQRAEEAGLLDDPIVVENVQSMLISRLKEIELMPQLAKLKICEEDAFNFYQQIANVRFTNPERVRVAVLWFDTRGRTELEEKYRPRLENIRWQLEQEPESIDIQSGFGTLAIQASEHQASRYKGGDIGWLEVGGKPDSWRNAVLEIAKGLKTPGENSPVVGKKEGLFLVRLIERRDRKVQDFETVKHQIIRLLKAEQQKRIEDNYLAKLYEGLDIKRYPENLKKIKDLELGEPDYNKSVVGPVSTNIRRK